MSIMITIAMGLFLQFPLPIPDSPFIIAPGFKAIPMTATGDAAFYKCIAIDHADSITCSAIRSTAITKDANDRFKAMMTELFTGKVRSAKAKKIILDKYKMIEF